MRLASSAVSGALLLVLGCTSKAPPPGADGAGGVTSTGGSVAGGGAAASGAQSGAGGEVAGSGGVGALPAPVPKYHPPPGFESCVHAEVKSDCMDGWCKLPPSCFVTGSPEGEWRRGLYTEDQIAVTLTHAIEVQQKELTRAEWTSITGLAAPGPELCLDANCPVAMVSWWDAVHAANLLSAQKGLAACYAPVGCTGALGVDLACTGVAEPDKSVYECEGYRLPTHVEAEYAARAGTWSTFYSGDITVYEGAGCGMDAALELIAWYCFNSGERPHAGGELQANGFGLYDLIGNIGEWSSEARVESSPSSPGGENPRGGVGNSDERLSFGGQYDTNNWTMTTTNLFTVSWGFHGIRTGFRLVRTLPD